MNDSLRVFKDSANLNSILEFPVNFVRTEMRSFTSVLNVTLLVEKNDVTPSKRLYVIDDVIKIKLSADWRHASTCSN